MKILKQLCLVCFSIFTIGACVSHSNNISSKRENYNLPSVIEIVRESIVLISASPNEDPTTNLSQNSLCSGAVVELQYIITNFHCIYKQKYLRIYFWDEEDWSEYKVKVVGRDPLADLSLLEVIGSPTIVPPLRFAEEIPEIGEDVFAMGHPMGMVWTVTKGIISSKDRHARHSFIKALQTDAAINVGNSGGPLLNMKGEIVGINALIVSKVKENAGIGLAIRSDIVRSSFKSMVYSGEVHRPAIGVRIGLLTSETQRKTIIKELPEIKTAQIPNTYGLIIFPTDNMPEGLQVGDTIVGVNTALVNNGVDLTDALSTYNIGETVTLTLIRKRRFIKVDVPLRQFEVPVESMYKK